MENIQEKEQLQEPTEQLLVNRYTNQGKLLRRLRQKKGLSQEALAALVPYSQSNISRIESKAVIEDDILIHFVKVFEMTMEEFKNYEGDEDINITIENNSFNEGSKSVVGNNITDSSTTHNYPLDKAVELYEQLLKVERKNNTLLEKQLKNLEKQFKELEYQNKELRKEIEELKTSR